MIKEQKQYVCEVLSKVINELERQEMEHRNKHKDKKLIDFFPQSTRYHISKIFESTSNTTRYSLGTANIKMIEGFLEDFKQALKERNEWDVYDSINYHYDLVEYPLGRLTGYFKGIDDMNERDAYIFTSFIADQFEKLKEIAQELDDKYNSKP